MFHLETQRVCSFILGALGHHNNDLLLSMQVPTGIDLDVPFLDATVKTLTLFMHIYILGLCVSVSASPCSLPWTNTLSGQILPLTSALAGNLIHLCTCRMF